MSWAARRIPTSPTPGSKPPLHFAAGWWVLPWLGALALVTWLLDPETHPKLFLLGFPIVAVIAVLASLPAVRLRQPRERMDEYIGDVEREAKEEPEAVSV